MVTSTLPLSCEAADPACTLAELVEADPAIASADALLRYAAADDEPPPAGLAERTLVRCAIDEPTAGPSA